MGLELVGAEVALGGKMTHTRAGVKGEKVGMVGRWPE